MTDKRMTVHLDDTLIEWVRCALDCSQAQAEKYIYEVIVDQCAAQFEFGKWRISNCGLGFYDEAESDDYVCNENVRNPIADRRPRPTLRVLSSPQEAEH